MKIVYILEQFFQHGGAEKIVSQKANWLSDYGYEVTIISNFQNHKPFIYNLNESINFIDLNINYNRKKSYFHPINFLKAPRHIVKLYNTLKKINPDIVITLSLQFDYYLLPFITKARTIREFHSSRYLYDINREKASCVRKIKYKLCDFIEKKYTFNVVLNKDERKHFRSENVVIIPNGIKTNSKLKAALNNKKVIAAGRLVPVKNFEALIKIWHEINKKFPDWKLEIYGDGDKKYKDKLQSLIHSLKLNDSCCLCGVTQNLENKMLHSSIYAMTSHTECYPMVLLEAKKVGLPIVSFNSPYGPKNIIMNNNDGFVVDLYDNKEFIIKIEALMNDVKLRKEYSEIAIKNFDNNNLNIVMKKWMNLLK